MSHDFSMFLRWIRPKLRISTAMPDLHWNETNSLSDILYVLYVRLQLTSASRKLFMQVSGIASVPSRASILCHVLDGLRKREFKVYLKYN